MPRLNWGAVILSSMAGTAAGLALLAVVSGVTSTVGSVAVLIFAQYLIQFATGFLSAHFAVNEPLLHGAAASLLLFAVATVLTLALDASRPGMWFIAFSALVAAILGSAGGSLAESLRLRSTHPAGSSEHDGAE